MTPYASRRHAAPAAAPAAPAAAAPQAATAGRYRRSPRRTLPDALHCSPHPLGPASATDARPAAVQAQRTEIEILRGEVASLQAAGQIDSPAPGRRRE